MNILFLRGFNNYFNRVIKKYSALADYQADCTAYVNFEGINFNPNDGVVTELVLGNESQKENSLPLDWENIGTPDYCICYQMEGNPSAAVIKSRWFILESERLRSGQYRIALKRDVVAEHFDTIKVSPCFIEKGMINDIENPLLYNKESMTYNQIKTDEIKISDTTGSGWIVGYVAKNEPASNTSVSVSKVIESESDFIDAEDLDFELVAGNNTFYELPDGTPHVYISIPRINAAYDNRYTNNMELFNVLDSYKVTAYTNGDRNMCLDVLSNMNSSSQRIGSGISPTNFSVSDYNTTSYMSQSVTELPSEGVNDCWVSLNGRFCSESVYPEYRGGKLNQYGKTDSEIINRVNSNRFWRTYLSNFLTYEKDNYYYLSTASNISQYNGKKILLNGQLYTFYITDTTNNYRLVYGHNINSVSSNYGEKRHVGNITQYGYICSLGTIIGGYVDNFIPYTSDMKYVGYDDSIQNINNSTFITRIVKKYTVNLSLYQTETLTTTIKSAGNRADTYDSPADFFMVPYGEVPFKVTTAGETRITNAERGIAIARRIAEEFGDSCYDLQIMPYCPSVVIQNLIDTYGYLDLSSLMSTMYSTVTSSTSSGAAVTFVLYPSSCTGTFDINKNITVNDYGYSTALNYKISNETELFRLISPNYNGQFEFSLAKNNGITLFNVDYTYKPYMSYVHINPDFKFLYGRDYNDSRGLVCGGDFSLTFVNSAWTNYKMNNKNYQQIFDRQILNMDVNNSIALEKQEFQATIGTITSGIGGAMGGAAAGATAGSVAGPWGAVIGGAVGAIGGGVGSAMASAYGAEKDREWLKAQQWEARTFAIDMYGYQLGNIQAMPYSLKGSDVLISNYKVFPILEYFRSTDAEVDALVQKIKYNGMTIMAVGKIEDYCTSEDFDKVFIKGQLIRLEADDVNDDFHIADAIYQEINKGVYIPSGGL